MGGRNILQISIRGTNQDYVNQGHALGISKNHQGKILFYDPNDTVISVNSSQELAKCIINSVVEIWPNGITNLVINSISDVKRGTILMTRQGTDDLKEDIAKLEINRSMTLYGDLEGADILVTHFKNSQGELQYSIEPASSSVGSIPLRIIVPIHKNISPLCLFILNFMKALGVAPGLSTFTYMKSTHTSSSLSKSKHWEGTYNEEQDAVKFTVRKTEDLKKILDLCEKMNSVFSQNPLLHTLLIYYQEDTGMNTVAPQNLDSALEFKITIAQNEDSQLKKYHVLLMSNPPKKNDFDKIEEVVQFIDQQRNNNKKVIEDKKEIPITI